MLSLAACCCGLNTVRDDTKAIKYNVSRTYYIDG